MCALYTNSVKWWELGISIGSFVSNGNFPLPNQAWHIKYPSSCSQTPNESLVLLDSRIDKSVFCIAHPKLFCYIQFFWWNFTWHLWRFRWQLVINGRQVAVILKIFSNILYRYGSITFTTEIVDFFSNVITTETDNVHIFVLIKSSSSLFVNLLISLDIGQVEISCINQPINPTASLWW